MNVKIQKVSPPDPQPPRIWTSLDLINWTKSYFEKKGIEQPRLEAELLLSDVLGCPRIRLYADFEKPVSAEHLARFREFVKRRGETREPLQYIVGHTQFLELKIKVTPAALIPRPETEILAMWAVDRAKEFGDSARIIDLCAGTGCIALHVASKLSSAEIFATDLSQEALSLAKENAATLKLNDRITFLQGDLFEALASSKSKSNVIVSNPPYVDEAGKATLQPEVRDHEPGIALYAGDSGLAIIRRIVEQAPEHLASGGWLGIEFGIGQANRILEIAKTSAAFSEMKIEKDAAEIERFLFAKAL